MTVRELIAALEAVPNKDAFVYYREVYDCEPELMHITAADYTECMHRLRNSDGSTSPVGVVLTS